MTHDAAELPAMMHNKGAATQMCQIMDSPADSHLRQAGCTWPHSMSCRAGPLNRQAVPADTSHHAFLALIAPQVT